MPRPRRSVISRCLRPVWDALITFGTYWVYIPPTPSRPATPPVAPPASGPPPELRGTGPEHPERVRPEIPLTPVERAIRDELRDLA